MNKFIFIQFLLFLISYWADAQNDSVSVHSGIRFSKRVFTIQYYPDVGKPSYRDSLVIRNPFQDIIDCEVCKMKDHIIVFYSTDGANNTTQGITLRFESYNTTSGSLKLDNKSRMPYGGNFRLRRFNYKFNNCNLVFTEKDAPGRVLTYDLSKYSAMEDLCRRIDADIKE